MDWEIDRRRAIAGLLVGLVLGVLAGVGVPAGPAAAHPPGIQAGTDFRTRVTGVTPAMPGVRVRFVDRGSRLELSNESGHTVEVLGYRGEPLIQVRPDGVWHNTRSPSLYVDAPSSPAKARADAAAPPEWDRVSRTRLARWHDRRTVWHGDPPPVVTANPDRRTRVLAWSVPVRDGGAEARITGTLDWLPPPASSMWWVGIVVAALAIGALGLLPAGSSAASSAARAGLGAAGVVAGAGNIGYALAVAGHSAAPGAGGFATEALGQLWALVAGVAVLAAAVAVLTRRSAASFFLIVCGAFVAFMAATDNADVFRHAVTPVPGDARWARLTIAAVIAGGIGLAIAGVVRLRQEHRHLTADPPAPAPAAPTPRADQGQTYAQGDQLA